MRSDACLGYVAVAGAFEQFRLQLIERLDASPEQLSRLHIMPTSGTKYLRFDTHGREWVSQYWEDLAPETRTRIVEVLTAGGQDARLLGAQAVGSDH